MPAPDPVPPGVQDLSGRDVEEGIARAERGTTAQGDHTLDESGPPGASRAERIVDVEETTEGRIERDPAALGEPPSPGPSPRDIGSGGAQRVEGARISDRVAGSEPVPDGPPFEDEVDRSA